MTNQNCHIEAFELCKIYSLFLILATRLPLQYANGFVSKLYLLLLMYYFNLYINVVIIHLKAKFHSDIQDISRICNTQNFRKLLQKVWNVLLFVTKIILGGSVI